MKKLLFLLTLIAGTGLYQTNQALTNTQTTSNNKTSEEIFIQKADECLALIEKASQKISIQGVAVIAYIPGNVSVSWISKMTVVGNLTSGKANLLGIAYTKASEMADTHLDSGSGVRDIYSGELGYKGGLIKKVNSGYILAVFSGGSGEQDLEVAKIGLDKLAEYIK
jgi:hypothetical protein